MVRPQTQKELDFCKVCLVEHAYEVMLITQGHSVRPLEDIRDVRPSEYALPLKVREVNEGVFDVYERNPSLHAVTFPDGRNFFLDSSNPFLFHDGVKGSEVKLFDPEMSRPSEHPDFPRLKAFDQKLNRFMGYVPK